MKDKLQEMLDAQKKLQEHLGTDFNALDAPETAQYMRNHTLYLEQELQEALYEMPYFKLWKNYSTMTDTEMLAAWDKVKMELVDAWHFFMNLLLCADINATDLYEMYMAKNKENYRRQKAGYTADVSYRDQSVNDVLNKGGSK